MYDYEFYAEVDSLIVKQLKRCGKTIGATILMLLIYLATLPVRLYERVKDYFAEEKKIEKEIDERFRNLKEYGHI